MMAAFAPNPRVQIRRATPADAGDLVRIYYAAFQSSVMTGLMIPGGVSADARAKLRASLFPEPAPAPSPVETIIMVAELLPEEAGGTGSSEASKENEIIAFAKWRLISEALPEEQWNVVRVLTEEDLGQGFDAGVYNMLIGRLHALRRKWIKGDPCLFLDLLVCIPARGRLGAGSALLAWGTELADREGKTAWLESSPTGYKLYRRFGFEDVDVEDLRVTETWGPVRKEGENWGAQNAVALAGEALDGVYRSVFMRRMPKKR